MITSIVSKILIMWCHARLPWLSCSSAPPFTLLSSAFCHICTMKQLCHSFHHLFFLSASFRLPVCHSCSFQIFHCLSSHYITKIIFIKFNISKLTIFTSYAFFILNKIILHIWRHCPFVIIFFKHLN